MKELSSKEKAALRNAAQRLKPAIFVGKAGVTAGVIEEMLKALASEGLVKVAFKTGREELQSQLEELAEKTGSSCVGGVGRRRSFYKERDSDSEDA